MKKLLPVIVAVLIAAFATVGILKWARGLSDQGQITSCMVAATALKAGARLSMADMRNENVIIPSNTSVGGRVWAFVFEELTSPEKSGTLVNRVLAQEVPAGRPILQSMLRPITQETAKKDWRTGITEGKRAVAIPVSGTSAVAGLVEVGDHVDIIVNTSIPEKEPDKTEKTSIPVPMGDKMGTIEVPTAKRSQGKPMTTYLLQDVEVLAVGNQIYNQEEFASDDVLRTLGAATKGGASITIALKPEQILLIAFAIANGNSSFMLTLRNQADRALLDADKVKPVTFETLTQALSAPN